MLNRLLSFIFKKLENANNEVKLKSYFKRFNLHPSVRLNYIEATWFSGNVEIDEHTYFNGGRIVTGPNSVVRIGKWCAIGHNVNIIAWTHDIEYSTGPIDKRPLHEKDIVIGNNVWIGSNVFIREGVLIGDNSIIAANSVVVKNVNDGEIVGGVPAKMIKYKNGYE